jgi:hypothetical protein
MCDLPATRRIFLVAILGIMMASVLVVGLEAVSQTGEQTVAERTVFSPLQGEKTDVTGGNDSIKTTTANPLQFLLPLVLAAVVASVASVYTRNKTY